MRTVNRRMTRDQLNAQGGDVLPDGIGGTVTGGPMEPIDLMRILARDAEGPGRGGAVPGAAHVVVSTLGIGGARSPAIALSDGSRISFASIADAGVFDDEAVRASEGAGALADA
jgi:hypothetical protein